MGELRVLMARGDRTAARTLAKEQYAQGNLDIFGLGFLTADAMYRGATDEAATYAEAAVAQAPGNLTVLQNLGYARLLDGRADALEPLARVLEEKPNAIAYLGAGTALLRRGDVSCAAHSFTRAFQLDPLLEQGRSDVPWIAEFAREGARHTREFLRQRQLAQGTASDRIADFLEYFYGREAPKWNDPLQRPSFVLVPDLEANSFWDGSRFPWVPGLSAATAAIRSELLQVLSGDRLDPYVDYEAGVPPQWQDLNRSLSWGAYHFFKGGAEFPDRLARCPATAEALAALPQAQGEGHAPDALFSILEPGAHIPPHFGLSNAKLTVHLPLIVPGQCAIRVGSEERAWSEGEVMIFDDSFEHEAWNRSEQTRAVLIVQIWHPDLSEGEQEQIARIITADHRWREECRTWVLDEKRIRPEGRLKRG